MNPGKIDYDFSISFIGGNDRNIYGVADWTDLEAKVKWGKLVSILRFRCDLLLNNCFFWLDLSGLLPRSAEIVFCCQNCSYTL